jgi:hypothetical protein
MGKQLIEQVFALISRPDARDAGPEGRDVLVISHWAGLAGGRRGLTSYRAEPDGTETRRGPRLFSTLAEVEASIAESVDYIRRFERVLTEDEARALLEGRGVEQETCLAGAGAGDCLETLPIGAFWCRYCGRSTGQAATTMAGGSRRERTFDLRVDTRE